MRGCQGKCHSILLWHAICPTCSSFAAKLGQEGYKEVYSSWKIRRGAFLSTALHPIKANKCFENLKHLELSLWLWNRHVLGTTEKALALRAKKPCVRVMVWRLPFLTNKRRHLLHTDTRHCALPALGHSPTPLGGLRCFRTKKLRLRSQSCTWKSWVRTEVYLTLQSMWFAIWHNKAERRGHKTRGDGLVWI